MEKWTKEERKAIGSRIQSHRKKKGLFQEDLANLVGLKVGTISKYEQGDRTPGIRQLSRIAEVLECNISELMTEPPSPETIGREHSMLSQTSMKQNSEKPPEIEQTKTDQPQSIQTDFDAFLQWLSLSSIKVTPLPEKEYLLQIGSKTFSLTEEQLSRIMDFLKKQFLKVLVQMAKKEGT